MIFDDIAITEGVNVCLSGGAPGSDEQWGLAAGLAGHLVRHLEFHGHKSRVPEQERVFLSAEQLADANPMVQRAAAKLGKSPPHRPWIRSLIQRNWYQVRDTQRVYAVSTIENHMVVGGTGWAVAMFILRMADQGSSADGLLHCFDQEAGRWATYRGGVWVAEGPPEPPQGIWTGIGTRSLLLNGKRAIRALLGVEGHF